MTPQEQQQAATEFAIKWANRGNEKSETHNYWIGLLQEVFGVVNAHDVIEFEKPVQLEHASFIDAYIESTNVLIEQKSVDIDLTKSYKQSDGEMLTPFQQAKRYAGSLPKSQFPRWIITCNFKSFLIYDMEHPKSDPEVVLLENLAKEYYRLQFLVDIANEQIQREMEVSIKAGKIVGVLYDEILKQYLHPDNAHTLKSLNVLCVRLVFCLYAEDAGVFGKHNMFHDFVKHFSAGDLRRALIDLFKTLDTKVENRDPYLDEMLAAFPYVNGGLFSDETIEIPQFNQQIVDLLLKQASEDFDWSEISPTIFGAVFESTLNPETRRKGGMHYTSIENIHKVIDPLFMNDLWKEFDNIRSNTVVKTRYASLQKFQQKISSLTFLDPACGSGNFLTETYISLRRLENKILTELNRGQVVLGLEDIIKVSIKQFYGIEINDFAVTVAKAALWIAESQMLKETENIVSMQLDFLPSKSYANIVEGNALRMDWGTFRPIVEKKNLLYADKTNIYQVNDDKMTIREPERSYNELNIITKEVEFKNIEDIKEPAAVAVDFDYIMGNPPFVGYGLQSVLQKEDTLLIYRDKNGKTYKTAGKIDYVSNWYFKASQLIQNSNAHCAFVSTNSITQGEQVASVWKPLFENFKIHIDFAYRTFRWDSESESKAHVHCVIVGFSASPNMEKKTIFIEPDKPILAKSINAYLVDAENIFIENRSKPICDVHYMTIGNRPADGGHLIIEENEYDNFIIKEPRSVQFIKNLTGAEEYINNKKRYCLWLVGISPAEIRKMPEVYRRVQLCRQDRLNGAADRQKLADTPALFREIKNPEKYIIVPRVSSEQRKYIPIGFMDDSTIPTDSALIIPDATLYDFGILTSSVHMSWMRAVCGRLKSDYRYSKDIVYNNFPWPEIEIRNEELGVRNEELGVRNEELGVRNEELGVRNEELGDRNEELEVRNDNILVPNSSLLTPIEKTAQAILDARNLYPDSSLADIYDETTMPPELRKAHQANDKAVMQAYGFDPNMSESEIVAELFKLYQKLTETPENKN